MWVAHLGDRQAGLSWRSRGRRNEPRGLRTRWLAVDPVQDSAALRRRSDPRDGQSLCPLAHPEGCRLEWQLGVPTRLWLLDAGLDMSRVATIGQKPGPAWRLR